MRAETLSALNATKGYFEIKKLLFLFRQVYFRFSFLLSFTGFGSKNIIILAFTKKNKGRKSTWDSQSLEFHPSIGLDRTRTAHRYSAIAPYKNFQMWKDKVDICR